MVERAVKTRLNAIKLMPATTRRNRLDLSAKIPNGISRMKFRKNSMEVITEIVSGSSQFPNPVIALKNNELNCCADVRITRVYPKRRTALMSLLMDHGDGKKFFKGQNT